MAQLVRVLATRPDGLSLTPQNSNSRRELTAYKLSSDFHRRAMADAHPPSPQHKINRCGNNIIRWKRLKKSPDIDSGFHLYTCTHTCARTHMHTHNSKSRQGYSRAEPRAASDQCGKAVLNQRPPFQEVQWQFN